MIEQYGPWIYAILFIVVFCETGLVFFPFLPGDSLIFAAGTLAVAYGSFSVWGLFIIFVSAAILGDTVNYWLGHYFGPMIFARDDSRLFRKKYLLDARKFFRRHGSKTVFLARFIPIIRTFAPFVAGVGAMDYRKFIVYNIVGALCWVSLFLGLGYLFGNLPAVRNNITFLFVVIIMISFVPLALGWLIERRKASARSNRSRRRGKHGKT